jgi:hypothetical protein
VSGEAVAAAADGQLQPGLARERDDLGDLGGVGGPMMTTGWRSMPPSKTMRARS